MLANFNNRARKKKKLITSLDTDLIAPMVAVYV